jgi:hypothetical protein
MVWPMSPGAMACSRRVLCSWTLRRSGGVIDPAAVSWIGTTIELANVQLWLQLGFEFPQNGRETPLVPCGVGMVGAKARFEDGSGTLV